MAKYKMTAQVSYFVDREFNAPWDEDDAAANDAAVRIMEAIAGIKVIGRANAVLDTWNIYGVELVSK